MRLMATFRCEDMWMAELHVSGSEQAGMRGYDGMLTRRYHTRPRR